MNEIINKKALVEKVSNNLKMTKKDTNLVLEAIFDEIKAILVNGDKVDIAGFGRFEIRERPSRMGINPSTKQRIEISETKSPKFKASKSLKDAVK